MRGIGMYGGQVVGQIKLEGRVFEDRNLEHMGHLLHHVVQIECLDDEFALAGVGQHLLAEFRGPLSCDLDGIDVAIGRRSLGKFQPGHVGVTQHPHEQIVEIVGDAAGHHPQALQLLDVLQLFLDFPLLLLRQGPFHLGHRPGGEDVHDLLDPGRWREFMAAEGAEDADHITLFTFQGHPDIADGLAFKQAGTIGKSVGHPVAVKTEAFFGRIGHWAPGQWPDQIPDHFAVHLHGQRHHLPQTSVEAAEQGDLAVQPFRQLADDPVVQFLADTADRPLDQGMKNLVRLNLAADVLDNLDEASPPAVRMSDRKGLDPDDKAAAVIPDPIPHHFGRLPGGHGGDAGAVGADFLLFFKFSETFFPLVVGLRLAQHSRLGVIGEDDIVLPIYIADPHLHVVDQGLVLFLAFTQGLFGFPTFGILLLQFRDGLPDRVPHVAEAARQGAHFVLAARD